MRAYDLLNEKNYPWIEVYLSVSVDYGDVGSLKNTMFLLSKEECRENFTDGESLRKKISQIFKPLVSDFEHFDLEKQKTSKKGRRQGRPSMISVYARFSSSKWINAPLGANGLDFCNEDYPLFDASSSRLLSGLEDGLRELVKTVVRTSSTNHDILKTLFEAEMLKSKMLDKHGLSDQPRLRRKHSGV